MSDELWAGLIGVAGVAVGAAIQIGGNLLTQYCTDKKARQVDDIRKTMLIDYLKETKHDGWVRIETLAQMVGAPLEHTRGLLIECKARGSLKLDKETWSLISRHPLKVES